ncbi:hypothetical protein [uncultured Clostridium sp.]|uniref:hypothetical protein n=1 Tax=uncultured Clostridium sp. TaxID=59620 RepID=UPI002609C5D9|nr:hypothetical protein [uncultured Clostridium sp.]
MERLKENEIAFNVWVALGFPSYAKIGEALGKSVGTIKQWSSRHKWAEQRDKWLEENARLTQAVDEDVNQKTLDQLIDESIQKIETGQIMVKTPKDILYLEEIRKSRMEAQSATSIDNLGGLVTAMAKGLIAEGMSSWDEIQDPDKEEQAENEEATKTEAGDIYQDIQRVFD